MHPLLPSYSYYASSKSYEQFLQHRIFTATIFKFIRHSLLEIVCLDLLDIHRSRKLLSAHCAEIYFIWSARPWPYPSCYSLSAPTCDPSSTGETLKCIARNSQTTASFPRSPQGFPCSRGRLVFTVFVFVLFEIRVRTCVCPILTVYFPPLLAKIAKSGSRCVQKQNLDTNLRQHAKRQRQQHKTFEHSLFRQVLTTPSTCYLHSKAGWLPANVSDCIDCYLLLLYFAHLSLHGIHLALSLYSIRL